MINQIKTTLLFFGLTLGIGLFFQNCGQESGSQLVNADYASESGDVVDAGFQNSNTMQEKLDANCVNNKHDLCAYYKNPIVGNSAQSHPTIAVRFPLLTTGELNDSSVMVMPFEGQILNVKSQAVNRDLTTAEGVSHLSQVYAFYWFHKNINLLRSYGAGHLLKDKLYIATESPATGFAAEKQVVMVGKNPKGVSLALDGSVVINLLGEAVVDQATGGKVNRQASVAKHRSCSSVTSGSSKAQECCSSLNGCSRAISAGLADFLVSLHFSNAPGIGEFVDYVQTGLTRCGISRNPDLTRSVASADFYNSCNSFGSQGHIYSMGSLYNSMWRTVFYQTLRSGQQESLKQLYFKLLPLLDGEDDFLTVHAKIKTLDSQISKGSLAAMFAQELTRRGYTVP